MPKVPKDTTCSRCGGRTIEGALEGRLAVRWRGKSGSKVLGLPVPGPGVDAVAYLCVVCRNIDLRAVELP